MKKSQNISGFCFNPYKSTANKNSSLSTTLNVGNEADKAAGDGIGYRSPYVSLQNHGCTSPIAHGRSVREFEEQMATLRKENFNLKLRLYFIEESIPGFQHSNSSGEGQETLMKQIIDSKVDLETLRKELAEKQLLLKEAAEAIELLENSRKDTEAKHQVLIDELNQKILYLETDRNMDKSQGSECSLQVAGYSNVSEDGSTYHKVNDLEDMIKDKQIEIEALEKVIEKLESNLSERDKIIESHEEKIKQLNFQNAEIADLLERKEKLLNSAEVIAATHTKSSNTQQTLSALAARLQSYETLINNIAEEQNLTKRENRFLKSIIQKLPNKDNCSSSSTPKIEKSEVCQQPTTDQKPTIARCYCANIKANSSSDYIDIYRNPRGNVGRINTGHVCDSDEDEDEDDVVLLKNYMNNCCKYRPRCVPPEIAIHCTLSDGSIYGDKDSSIDESCTTLQKCFSETGTYSKTATSYEEVFSKDQNRIIPRDGMRYVYSKFGNFH